MDDIIIISTYASPRPPMQCTRGYAEIYAMHPHSSTSQKLQLHLLLFLRADSSSRDEFPQQFAQAANDVKGLGMCQRLSLNGKIAVSADSGSLVRAGRYRFFIPLSESTPSSSSLSPLSPSLSSRIHRPSYHSSFPLLLLPIYMTQRLAASFYLA